MKMGMVLSGGGAKGAYQVGLFRAIEELGLRSSVAVLSGCSIGSINALLFCGSDRDTWENVWRSLRYEDLMLREAAAPGTAEGGITHKLVEIVGQLRRREREITSLRELLSSAELLPFSQEGMRAMTRLKVDFDRVAAGPDIWLCAYNLEREQPEYFNINKLGRDDIVELAMASSSIPLIFPPIVYRGCNYCDGGIAPPYLHKSNADKVPVKPLAHAGCDLVVVVYLSHYDRVSLDEFPEGTRLLELYPSSPLEMIRGAGTLNLSKETLADNLLLGYHDGLAAFAPLLLELAQGGSGERALANHAEYNRQLLDDKLPLLQRAEEALAAKLSKKE